MEPQIQYAKTSDGVSIAYTALGDGPPLVATISSWESIRFASDEGFGGRFYEDLAHYVRVVRYDRRGVGLSDTDRTDFTIAADVRDLEAVADALALPQFALLGIFHLGPAAIAYAASHPERISHLILYGTYACGSDLTREEVRKSLVDMLRSHWGIASRAIVDMVAPALGGELLDRVARLTRASVSGEMAANLLEMAYATDVTDLLSQVRAPTLVLHRAGDHAAPFRLGRELSVQIAGARFAALDGNVPWPWLGDSDAVVAAMLEFLGMGTPARRPSGQAPNVVTILFTDLTSSTALTQRLGDAKAQELVRAHNAIVREALKNNGGSEIKHTGDGIMASFPTASGALECAVAIQRNMEQGTRNMALPHPIEVHVGLNSGEPIAEESDLFGTAVQLARRICDHAGGGEILASDVVRQLAAGKNFLFSDRGDVVPKGFDEAVRLYEVRWREEG